MEQTGDRYNGLVLGCLRGGDLASEVIASTHRLYYIAEGLILLRDSSLVGHTHDIHLHFQSTKGQACVVDGAV